MLDGTAGAGVKSALRKANIDTNLRDLKAGLLMSLRWLGDLGCGY